MPERAGGDKRGLSAAIWPVLARFGDLSPDTADVFPIRPHYDVNVDSPPATLTLCAGVSTKAASSGIKVWDKAANIMQRA
jgi:hypothetical protein